MLPGKPAGEVQVIRYIGLHRRIPLVPVLIGSLRSRDPEGGRLVISRPVHFPPEQAPELRIRDEDVGLLQSRQIEGFAWGCGRDREVPECFLHLLENVVFPLPGEVEMDLIAEYRHMVLPADPPDLPQFLRRPYPAHRVVRTAQDEQLYVVPDDLPLKIIRVHGVAPVRSLHQVGADRLPAVDPDQPFKRVINRLLDDHGVIRLGKCPDCRRDREAYPGRFDVPGRIHMPVVVSFHPAADRLKKAVPGLGIGVSVDVVPGQLRQCVLHV